MAKEYDLITREQFISTLRYIAQTMNVSVPYLVNEDFSPRQAAAIGEFARNITNAIINAVDISIYQLKEDEVAKINRCFLCDKKDKGGPNM